MYALKYELMPHNWSDHDTNDYAIEVIPFDSLIQNVPVKIFKVVSPIYCICSAAGWGMYAF